MSGCIDCATKDQVIKAFEDKANNLEKEIERLKNVMHDAEKLIWMNTETRSVEATRILEAGRFAQKSLNKK